VEDERPAPVPAAQQAAREAEPKARPGPGASAKDKDQADDGKEAPAETVKRSAKDDGPFQGGDGSGAATAADGAEVSTWQTVDE
jgi:hypothetical protein